MDGKNEADKKPYVAPQLIEYGDLIEVTGATGNNPPPDGALGVSGGT